MKFIIVLVTTFSACCCYSILNPDPNQLTDSKSQSTKVDLQNDPLTDEEILRCLSSISKVNNRPNQRLTQEETEESLVECNLRLGQNTETSEKKDNFNKSPPFKNQDIKQREFITNKHSIPVNSEKVNGKNTEKDETFIGTSARKNDGNYNFIPLPGEYEDSKEAPSDEIFKTVTESSGFWSFFFRSKDSADSLHKISDENFVKGPIAESRIDLEYATGLENPTTEEYGTVMWNIVMPGTKWCGSGNTAAHDDDLGYFEDVDRCCRAHDKCDDLMTPGQSRHNLTNTSAFTVLHCKCDDELYECLSKIDSTAANTVANAFFNIFARKCYMLDYTRKCTKYDTRLRCLEYEIDKTAEKVYQWKPAKKYLKRAFAIAG